MTDRALLGEAPGRGRPRPRPSAGPVVRARAVPILREERHALQVLELLVDVACSQSTAPRTPVEPLRPFRAMLSGNPRNRAHQTRGTTNAPLSVDTARWLAEAAQKECFSLFTYTDKTLTCVDCGTEFAFTASDQQFYADRQFSEPRRCPACRAAKKAARGESSGGYSNGGGYSSGGGGYGGGYSDQPARDVHHHVRQLWQGSSRPVPPDRHEARLLQRLLPALVRTALSIDRPGGFGRRVFRYSVGRRLPTARPTGSAGWPPRAPRASRPAHLRGRAWRPPLPAHPRRRAGPRREAPGRRGGRPGSRRSPSA